MELFRSLKKKKKTNKISSKHQGHCQVNHMSISLYSLQECRHFRCDAITSNLWDCPRHLTSTRIEICFQFESIFDCSSSLLPHGIFVMCFSSAEAIRNWNLIFVLLCCLYHRFKVVNVKFVFDRYLPKNCVIISALREILLFRGKCGVLWRLFIVHDKVRSYSVPRYKKYKNYERNQY